MNKLFGVIYPNHVLQNLSEDMHILDVGAGKGEFVRDLQKLGFRNARGIDREEASRGVLRVNIAELDADHYRGKLDRIFSSWSLFTYKESATVQKESLRKMADWLKPGGRIYLGPVDKSLIDSLLQEVPALISSDGDNLFGSDDQHWVELSKR